MVQTEVNERNPTIEIAPKKRIAHDFLIKYENEEQRIKFSDMVIELIKKHELKEFHVDEIKAFQTPKIKYNDITLVEGNDFSFEDLDNSFQSKL
ncbi:MAG: hypothetical protein ACOCXG_05790 [Nanoarchaeota archaeon]